MVPQNSDVPHVTAIWIVAKTYEVLPTGECSGTPVYTHENILRVEGKDKAECLEKTQKILQEFNNVSSNSKS